MDGVRTTPATPTAAERFGILLTSWVDRLPPVPRRFLPREFVGFAILGTFTFLIDMAILSALKTWTTLPLPVDVGAGYIAAFGLNYVLNRTVNFRSHAPVGGQLVRFTVVTACDFALTLGVPSGLSSLGIDFRIARVLAAMCVAVFTYVIVRFWVFRK
jgi:putative flippase GtrA